jgi:hypothetical protein
MFIGIALKQKYFDDGTATKPESFFICLNTGFQWANNEQKHLTS